MKKIYWIVGIIIIVSIGITYYIFSNQFKSSQQSTPSCSEMKGNLCTYNNTTILSDLDALMWIKNNIPSNSSIIAWHDYDIELKNIGNVKTASEVAFDLTLYNTTQFLCGAKHLDANYLYLTGRELLYTGYMRYTPIIQPFRIRKINETDYISDDGKILIKFEDENWVPYAYYEKSESGGLKISQNISKIKKIIYLKGVEIKTYEFSDSTLNFTLLFYPSFSTIYLIQPNFENSILIRFILLDDKIENFSKIYDENNIKIYSLDTTFLNKDCYW